MGARAHDERWIVRQVGPETVVYDRRRHRAHCLPALAAAVWREVDGQRSIGAIAARVSAARGERIDEMSVAVALRRLERAGLVDRRVSRGAAGSEGREVGPGAGRREAMRRVAALAGLAVVSIVAPTPEAAAATCKPNFPATGFQCQASSECCSKCCSNLIAPPGNSACVGNPPAVGGCR